MPERIALTKAQARRYMLLHQGLLGPARYCGKTGVLAYVRAAGAIQFDPVDVCGMNADIVLQARVSGYRKEMLRELLYEDHVLYEHFDKQMCILPVETWPALADQRAEIRSWPRVAETIAAHAAAIRRLFAEAATLSAAELDLGRLDWYWGETTKGRATLEAMFYAGELLVSRRERAIRHFAPADRVIPADLFAAPDPFSDKCARTSWRILRRIGAVGALWDRRSDALLGLSGLDAATRTATIADLVFADRLSILDVEDLDEPLYVRTEDLSDVLRAKEGIRSKRHVVFLAPLDAMLWDRKLIRKLFDFDYSWEIYTPAEKLKYAHYTLPVLFGESFAGRAELRSSPDRTVLLAKRFWPEPGFRRTKAFETAYAEALARFAESAGYAGVAREDLPEKVV
jgi:uncharacterized protein YcaQ